MSMSSFCVKRPVTTTMIYLALVLIGTIAWTKMPRELFTNISFPQLTVVTHYGNAAPEEMENLITKLIEEGVGTVPNLKRVRSISKEGVSLVTLEFDWGTDMGLAHLAAREKIDQIKDRLPSEAEEPIINRMNPFARPMMIYSISGEVPMPVLTDIAKRVIKQRLEKVNGVASAAISGGKEREILVEVDRGRMEASKVSLAGVVDSLKNTNLNYPAGTTQGKFYEYLVRTIGEFKNIGEIGRTVIQMDRAPGEDYYQQKNMEAGRMTHSQDDRFVHLEAIAEVKDTFRETTSYSRYNGQENVSISIQKQADANAIKSAARVKNAIEEIKATLPEAVRLELVYDETSFIKTAINGVFTDGVVGAVLAFIVLFLFLNNLKDAAIVSMAIPMSVMTIFILMYFKGISLNMLSLAGLGLAIGNLVDNSIVVVENTARVRSEGGDVEGAAIEGANEVGSSMVSSGLTNAAVILPLLVGKGLSQQLFMDLFFSTIGASIVSMIVSLSLIPRLVAHPLLPAGVMDSVLVWFRKILPKGKTAEPQSWEGGESPEPARKSKFIMKPVEYMLYWCDSARGFGIITQKYRKILDYFISNPKVLSLILAGVIFFAGAVFVFHEKVFMPKFDQGQFIIRVNMPVGTRLEVTDRVTHKVEEVLKETVGIRDLTANVGSASSEAVEALGSHQGQVVVSLEREEINRPTVDVIAELKEKFDKLNVEGADIIFVLQDSVLSSLFETAEPVVVEIKGPDLTTLKKISMDIMEQLNQVPGLFGVKSSFALPSSETRVSIDKDRSSAYQLSVAEIARTALIGIKGFVATTYKEGGQEVNVRVQLRPEDRASVDDIRMLSVRAPSGVMVPLSEIADLKAGQGPSEIKRVDQQRTIVVSANVLKRSVSDVLVDVKAIVDSYEHLADYNLYLTGESSEVKEAFGGLSIALIFASILVYMIMAAEFESFIQPLIIMTTVPFCVAGVAFTVFFSRIPISAPVILGTIILAGQVVNSGIVLIDFMNHLKEEGKLDLREIVLTTCTTRLRAISMSVMVTLLGVFPLALGLSEGSEISSPVAKVTFGGLLVSSLLCLFVVPVIYFYFEQWQARKAALQAVSEGSVAESGEPAPEGEGENPPDSSAIVPAG